MKIPVCIEMLFTEVPFEDRFVFFKNLYAPIVLALEPLASGMLA